MAAAAEENIQEGRLTEEPELMIDTAVILKRFEEPDEVRTFDKGRFEIVRIGTMAIGRATYEPGWKWSEHVGPSAGQTHCCVEHLGLVVSGHATAAMQTGVVHYLTAGTLFYTPADPHDSWVVGDQPHISLHFIGADKYTRGPVACKIRFQFGMSQYQLKKRSVERGR